MIITQTPLRISFFGGGTDFADFYRDEEGCVISSTIDKYIYVIVKQRFDEKIRVGYTRTELVDELEDLQHELIREALRTTGVRSQIEIGTLGDIPSTGSGLGSSSTVTIGTLNALYTYKNEIRTQDTLAKQACEIEIERLQKPIGKQDQYIAAYGGFRFLRFKPDGDVEIETISLNLSERRRLNQHLLLFYTNTSRKSESILHEQREQTNSKRAILREMRAQAYEGRSLLENGDFESFGRLLDEGWRLKKSLATKISNPAIDELYAKAKTAGALGGKITGAGGGGFLLLFCPREKQYQLRESLSALKELPFHLENDGTKVIFNYRNHF